MTDFKLRRGERKVVVAILRQNLFLYFLLSWFFTREERARLAVLSVWLKQAHDLLNLPEEKILPTLKDYQQEFRDAWKGKPIKHLITLLFVRMAKAYEFDPDWCELYLESLQEQVEKKSYANWRELNRYIFTSAEMVVHMLAALFDLKPRTFTYLRELARWWQKILLFSSLGQDWQQRQRMILPEALLKEHELSPETVHKHQHDWQFFTLMKNLLSELQQEAKTLRSESKVLPVPFRGVSLVLLALGERQITVLWQHPQTAWTPRPTLFPVLPSRVITLRVWWQLIGQKRYLNPLKKITEFFARGKLRRAESRA